MKNTTWLLLLALLVCSCTKRQSLDGDRGSFFVNLDKDSTVSISDLFSKVELIPLENTPEVIVGEPIREMRVDKGHLYFLAGKQ